mgnify:CR=1 FL=1
MPERLLPLLTTEPQSGDELGARLGVGRVTVNTLARKLAEDGVPVVISRGGYALEAGTPAPGLVKVTGQFGRAMRYAGTVGSTQDEIRHWADDAVNPAPHGAVCVAERQTLGRGRRGRVWDTAAGALAFSVLLRGDGAGRALTLPEVVLMPLAAGVALHDAGMRRPTLDDVFFALTGHGTAPAQPDTAPSGTARTGHGTVVVDATGRAQGVLTDAGESAAEGSA